MKDLGVSAAVVLKLCERIEKKGHVLYFDNYFNSYNLLQVLKSKEIFAGGTARVSRFSQPPLLDNVQMKKQPRGYAEECVSEDGDVVVCKWQDKRSVVMASNFLLISEGDVVRRWDKKNRCFVNVPRPEVIKDYNDTMGGVDLMDRLISFYRIDIRSKKWPLKLTFHAVDFAVTNAWLEYRKDCKTLKVPKKNIGSVSIPNAISESINNRRKNSWNQKKGTPFN